MAKPVSASRMNGGVSTVETAKSVRSRSDSTMRFTAMSRSPIAEMFAVSVVSQPGSTQVYVSHFGSASSPGGFGSSSGPPEGASPHAKKESTRTERMAASARLFDRAKRSLEKESRKKGKQESERDFF